MTRYNPSKLAHRYALGRRILHSLQASGFVLDTSGGSAREDVYDRALANGVTVRVFTSVVRGEVRRKDADAIRVCAVLDRGGETRGLVKSVRVRRQGAQEQIIYRMNEAIRKVSKQASKRANDPSFLALPTKGAKQASKRPSAKRINDAVKAAPKKAATKPAFKVGMLVKSSPTMGSRTQPDATPLRGMVKAIQAPWLDQGSIHVFWFHDGRTAVHPAAQIVPLVAE